MASNELRQSQQRKADDPQKGKGDDKKKPEGGEKTKRKLPEGLEAAMGIGGRALLKKGFKRFMSMLQKKQEDFYRDMAWLFIKDEAKDARNIFQGFLITGAVLAENLADIFHLPKVVVESIEIVLGDLPGTISDYFENRKSAIVFPEGYTGPSLEESSIRQLAERFNELIKGWFRDWFGGWTNPLLKITSFFEGKDQRFMHTLTAQPLPVVRKFFRFLQAIGDEGRKIFLELISYYDEPQELIDFLKYPLDVQLELFQIGRELHDKRWWPTILRWWPKLKTWWAATYPQFTGLRHEVLVHVVNSMTSWNEEMTLKNVTRQLRIEAKRYSTAGLEKRPERIRELADDDHRKIEFVATHPKQFRKPWWQRLPSMPIGLAAVGVVIVGSLVFIVAGCLGNHPPSIQYNYPADLQSINQLPLVVSGQAADDERVTKMEVEINGRARKHLFILPAPVVDWQWRAEAVHEGLNTVTFYAYDNQGRVGSGTISFRYEPPAPTIDSTPTPARVDTLARRNLADSTRKEF